MEDISGEHTNEYYKEMYDKIQSLIRRDTWEVVPRNSVSDHNMIIGTWYLHCKRKYDWTTRKFKSGYCIREYLQKRLSPETLNSYSTVVQWVTVIFILILQCIIGLQSQKCL